MLGSIQPDSVSEEFYEELVGSCRHTDEIQAYDLSESRSEALAKSASTDGLYPCPPARTENDSSVILGTLYEVYTYLLSGDAGPRALERAKDSFELADCRWMQVTHHGTRSNVTASLIEHVAPQTAYISAPGNDDHPHRSVVNTFKKAGSIIYSTHYPRGDNLYPERLLTGSSRTRKRDHLSIRCLLMEFRLTIGR